MLLEQFITITISLVCLIACIGNYNSYKISRDGGNRNWAVICFCLALLNLLTFPYKQTKTYCDFNIRGKFAYCGSLQYEIEYDDDINVNKCLVIRTQSLVSDKYKIVFPKFKSAN